MELIAGAIILGAAGHAAAKRRDEEIMAAYELGRKSNRRYYHRSYYGSYEPSNYRVYPGSSQYSYSPSSPPPVKKEPGKYELPDDVTQPPRRRPLPNKSDDNDGCSCF